MLNPAGFLARGEREAPVPTADPLERQSAERRSPSSAPHVLAINRVSFMGGVERVLLSAASEVAHRGWKTALACPPGDLADLAQNCGLPLYITELDAVSQAQIGRSPAGWLKTAAQINRGSQAILRSAQLARPRILHVHHPAVALQTRAAARRLRAPLIWHVHETAPMPLAYRAAAAIAVRSCDAFLCVSDASRDMVRELGAQESRIRLIYNAADPTFFEAVEPAPGLWPEGPNIGLFGVLEPRKGHADLIRALAMISGDHPTAHLWMIGGPSFKRHTGYQAALERLAHALGIADRVHFTGRRTDVPELMARMDAVVSASVCSESLPTTLVEACALGRPIIGTDVGGTREIFRDGESGLLVPPGEPGELANALQILLSPTGRRLGNRARAEARLRFSPARFAADIDDCYRQLSGWRPEHLS